MKIGIFFGGPSREREIAFAGGRTVYDNLDKSLFEPIPIFVDSLKNFILLDWKYIYKGSIRDFYPPAEHLSSSSVFQLYIESLGNLTPSEMDEIIKKVGRKILPHEFPTLMDFAFLALHGYFGEDGEIQGLLETYDIPYSGSGILPSSIGMNKAFQKRVLSQSGFPTPKFLTISRDEWLSETGKDFYKKAVKEVGEKIVIRPANQGSSIGVSILLKKDAGGFAKAVDSGFFIQRISAAKWKEVSKNSKEDFIRTLTDIREGIGIPVSVKGNIIHHPASLLEFIDGHFSNSNEELLLESVDRESEVLVEAFIEGKEFSCIVLRNADGNPLSLPPTEIVKGREVFDYRSKYLAGLSRKVTPIRLEDEKIEAIRTACEKLFAFFGFHVYARIDGFIQNDGTIFLNDPNTTSGMLPSSFFFHQAAEIGLNPSQFLTFIIRTSLEERLNSSPFVQKTKELLEHLDNELVLQKSATKNKLKIAVLLGGYSTERHISVESGRNIFEKLSSSEKYQPIPVFLTGNADEHQLYKIPINILLKDNADDIKEKIGSFKPHPVIEKIKEAASEITRKYASSQVKFEPEKISYLQLSKEVAGVFIALHGRPGEDGSVQQHLEKYHVAYNGSGIQSSQITINKYETNQLLKKHGFSITEQSLITKEEWAKDEKSLLKELLKKHRFPLIAKPVDEGCSSAVKKIKDEETLHAYFQMIFRENDEPDNTVLHVLKLKPKEEFPRAKYALLEDLIEKGDAKYFLEITGGMLTHYGNNGEVTFEVFEPSETLAEEGVLSLEEKFLAGEGQNITPARFGSNQKEYEIISEKVKRDLENAARILNVEGYCRIDAFVRVYNDMSVETVIIEINSLPGMTPATCIFHQAAINGYKPYDFIDNILEFSFKKRQVESH